MQNVFVSTVVSYEPKVSNPEENKFIFKYEITIQNDSAIPIQLLRRTWHIFDLSYGFALVKGEGVIGLQPEILPGERFTYFSFCNLQSGLGSMTGFYDVLNLINRRERRVDIPKFTLIADMLLN